MHKKQPGSSVASVTVTYNPDPKTLQRQLDQVSPQVSQVFLIDNGSSNTEEINRIAESIAHVRVILCQTNLGLGHAQNLGIRACRDEGMAMVLLLDQDSVPRSSMVETLLTALNELTQVGEKVAAVGARYTGSHTGHPSFFVQFKLFLEMPVLVLLAVNQRIQLTGFQFLIKVSVDRLDVFAFKEIFIQGNAVLTQPVFRRTFGTKLMAFSLDQIFVFRQINFTGVRCFPRVLTGLAEQIVENRNRVDAGKGR